MRKPSWSFPIRSYTIGAAQPQKTVRDYLDKKALISCAVTMPLICVFVLAYALSMLSHIAAHLLAHQCHRLICEFIGYSWSGVRRRRPSTI